MSDKVELTVGDKIAEAKRLDDTNKKKSKELSAFLLTHPHNLSIIKGKADLSTMSEDLLEYLETNEIEGMSGNGYGKISKIVSQHPSGIDWTDLYKDIIRKVLLVSAEEMERIDLTEEGIKHFLDNTGPEVLAIPFSILKRDVNSDTFKSLVDQGKKPEYIQIFEKTKLSLTK